MLYLHLSVLNIHRTPLRLVLPKADCMASPYYWIIGEILVIPVHYQKPGGSMPSLIRA